MLNAHVHKSWVFIAALAAVLTSVTILCYRPAWSGDFIWDDDYYVTKNHLLTAPDGLRKIWFSLESPSQYFPLTYTTLRWERQLWGLNPTGYHWVNILLHAANATLLWRLLVRLRVPGAYLAALIFALHPVQVESVAWISERKNVLMGLFFLLTLRAWISFLTAETQGKRRIFYLLGLIAFALALTAKTTACTLPAALLLLLWWRGESITTRRLLQIGPFVLFGLAMGLVTLWWERYHAGTQGELFQIGLLQRVLIASRGIWFYLSKLVWPSDLTFIYPQWKISVGDPWLYAAVAACLAGAALIFVFRSRLGRGPEVAAIFFVATLSPVLGFVMLYTFRYTFVADHYQYLAAIGPIALFAGGIGWLDDKLQRQGALLVVSGAIAGVLLGTLTWKQAGAYKDVETLWKTTIARNPGCWMAYNNLGIALFDRGQIDEAISQYRQSLRFRPNFAQSHYNLSVALLEKGDVDQAIEEGREAIRLDPSDSDVHVALGNALLARGLTVDAIALYEKAINLRPSQANAHYNLGNALAKSGNETAALQALLKATELDPTLIEAHMQLADIMARQHRWPEAIAQYSRVIELQPDSAGATNNLAWILASCPDTGLRDGRRAVELAEEARRLTNNQSSVPLHTLAAAYAQDRQFDRAVEVAQQALERALQENNLPLAEDLRREIEIYRSRSPYPAS